MRLSGTRFHISCVGTRPTFWPLWRRTSSTSSCQPELIGTAALATLIYTWYATSRFNHEVVACRFCGERRAHRQARYLKSHMFCTRAHGLLFYEVVGEKGVFLLRWGRQCCAKCCSRGWLGPSCLQLAARRQARKRCPFLRRLLQGDEAVASGGPRSALRPSGQGIGPPAGRFCGRAVASLRGATACTKSHPRPSLLSARVRPTCSAAAQKRAATARRGSAG